MIQIQPEVEALIHQRFASGKFASLDAVLLQALTDAPLPTEPASSKPGPTGAEIIAAFQSCPVKDFNFEHPSYVLPISDPVKF